MYILIILWMVISSQKSIGYYSQNKLLELVNKEPESKSAPNVWKFA